MKYNITILFVLICQLIFAQETSFTKFDASPLNTAPQYASVLPSTIVFHAQNDQTYHDFSLYGNFDIFKTNKSRFSYAPSIVYSQAGESKFTYKSLSNVFSYSNVLFDKDSIKHQLAIGIKPIIAERSIKEGDLRWPSQIEENFGPVAELIPAYRFANMNASLGMKSSFGKTELFYGLTANNITRPKINSISKIENRLNVVMAYYAFGKIQLSNRFTLHPQINLTKYSYFNYYVVGSDIGLKLNNNTLKIGGGVTNNANYYCVGLDLKRISINGLYHHFINNAPYQRWSVCMAYRL